MAKMIADPLSPAQRQRQSENHREGGRYALVNPCYCCGKSAGIDYDAHPLTDTGNWDDAAICLCGRCYKNTKEMTDVAQYEAYSASLRRPTAPAVQKSAAPSAPICDCCGKKAPLDFMEHIQAGSGDWGDNGFCLCDRCAEITVNMTDVNHYLAFSAFVKQRTGRVTAKMVGEIFNPKPIESVSLSGTDSAQKKGSKTMSRKTPRAQSSLTHIAGVEIEDMADIEAKEPKGNPVKKMRAVGPKKAAAKKAKAEPKAKKAVVKKPKAAPAPMGASEARVIELQKQIVGFKKLKVSHARAIAKLDAKSPKALLLKARVWHRDLCIEALERALREFDA